MTDILIRNVAEEDLRRIDGRAARLGLSRNEYLKRTIAQEAGRGDSVAGISDLRRFGELSADLLDEDVMRRAWS